MVNTIYIHKIAVGDKMLAVISNMFLRHCFSEKEARL